MPNLLRDAEIALACLIAGLASHDSAYAQPVLTNLGTLGGGGVSEANAISADGRAVTGQSAGRAFVWIVQDGPMRDLGQASGILSPVGYGINASGSMVVGGDANTAIRWTAVGGLGRLDPSQTSGCRAYSVSSSGTVVTGYFTPLAQHRAFRWTIAGGFQDLGTLSSPRGGGVDSEGRAVSENGTTIVGDSDYFDTFFGRRAFRWTSAGGMQNLGLLPGLPDLQGWRSGATAVNSDGTVVVGWSNAQSGSTRAFRWTGPSGMENLGVLGGAYMSIASAVNGDGRLAGGYCGFSSGGDRAFLWTANFGMVDLNQYLGSLGTNMTGWTLTRVTGLSSDGRSATGNGIFNGSRRAWHVRSMPSPCVGIDLHPQTQVVCASSAASYGVVGSGPGLLQYRWEFRGGPASNWTALVDGANRVSGALLLTASGATTPSISLSPPDGRWTFAGRVRCVVTSSCASLTSTEAALTVCASDFNCDGFLDFFDYSDFVTSFEIGGGLEADFNRDGFVDFFDYSDFVLAFETGC
jgi:probable HAF family extracellular repeat protein